MDLTPDQRLARRGRHRHRVIDRAELHALGFSDTMIRTREARGQLHRQWPGVWSIGARDLSFTGRCRAAVLTVGDDGVISHRSAGALYGFWDEAWTIDVSVPRDLRDREGLRMHESHTLTPECCRTVRGVRVTTVPRTLLDLADVLGLLPLEAAIDRALARDLLEPAAVLRTLDGAWGRRGVPVLREALGLTLTRSQLERMFLRLVDAWALPRPETNVELAGWEVDCWWPSQGLAVELDGWRFHRTRRSFEADHDRDLELRGLGINVLRLTYRQLTRRAATVEAALRRELAST